MDDANANHSLGSRFWPTGWHVHHVAETGSTNADMVIAAGQGAPHHSVLVTDFQLAGRGRLDRQWDAEPGANLLTSVLFRPQQLPERPIQQYTHMVGLAARKACIALCGVEVEMKWPNDLLIGEQKLAGILAQNGADYVVVGIGLNVRWAPQGATSLRDASGNNEAAPLDVLAQMLIELDRLEFLDASQLHHAYVEALSTIGRAVRIELATGDFLEGRAMDVDVDGRLVVLDECAITHRIEVGDVIHLRRK